MRKWGCLKCSFQNEKVWSVLCQSFSVQTCTLLVLLSVIFFRPPLHHFPEFGHVFWTPYVFIRNIRSNTELMSGSLLPRTWTFRGPGPGTNPSFWGRCRDILMAWGELLAISDHWWKHAQLHRALQGEKHSSFNVMQWFLYFSYFTS